MSAAVVSTIQRRERVRRIARRILLAALALLALLVAAGAILVYKAAAIVHAGAVAQADRFGARIGRTITVGPARVDVGAEVSIELAGIRVAAAPGQSGPAALPLFEVAAVRVRVPVWSVLRSLGNDVEVRAIEARGPVLRLVRLPGGDLSYADVVEKLAAAEPLATSRRARVGRVQVSGARAELHDLARDVHLAVDHIDALVPEIPADAPFDLALDAAVLATAQNLHVDLRIAPLSDPRGTIGRLRRAALRLAPLDVEPILPFIPVRAGIAGGRLSADLALSIDPKGPIAFSGTITAGALRLAHEGGAGADLLGQPVDVALRAEVTVDPGEPSIDARSFSLTVGGMTLEGRADVRGPVDVAEVRALDLRARDLTFERLLALAPPAWLPRGLSLAGPFDLRASAHGPPRAAEIDISADLRDASVILPDLHKPPGIALAAELKGRIGDGLEIDSLGVRLGPFAVALRGRVRTATDVDLAFDSGDVALDAILRLFPTIARSIPAGTTLAGHVKASGHVERRGAETRADAKVALRDAGVKTSALTLEGAADFAATARLAPGATAITIDLDAGGVRARVPDKLDKPKGSPLSVHARVQRAGPVTHAHDVRIHVAGASASGSVRHDAAAHAITIEAPACEIDLASLARAVPALARLPAPLAGSSVRGKVSYEGDTRSPGAAHLRIVDLDLRAPMAHVAGTLDLRGLSPLGAVTFDLSAPYLDLDNLPGGRASAGAPVALDGISASGKVHLGRLHAGKLDAADVDAELALEKGALSLSTLRLAAYGGRLSAGGSRLVLFGGAPAFSLRARAERLDLSSIVGGTDLRGRLDGEVSLDGQGADWAAISPTLAGTVKVSLAGAHVHGKHTLRGTIINPLLGKIAERARKKHPVREVDTNIERASVALRIAGGRVTTDAPFIALTDEGTLTMEGTVGLDRTLAVRGSVVIPPAAIERASKGWLVPSADATVKLRVDGTTDAPRIELLDLAGTMRSLRGSLMTGLGKKIDHALGDD